MQKKDVMKLFKVKDTGEIVSYPEHFANHPVFGQNLELIDGEIEVDKVVVDDHELPVEQRISYVERVEEPEEPEETEVKTQSKKKETR